MITERITSKANWLHRLLITGVASLSLLGVLSGCSNGPSKSSQIKKNVHTVESKNLNTEIPNYKINSGSLTVLIRDQFKALPSDSSYSDMVFHNGYLETRDGDGVSSDRLDDYTKNYMTDNHKQYVRYHINNQRKTITFTSNHVRNSLASITYKLSVPHVTGTISQIRFKPIYLRRFSHKHRAKIDGLVARHNRLYLVPTFKVIGGGASSLSTVQHKK